eukprot:1733047-Prymnesium_polylepis.1
MAHGAVSSLGGGVRTTFTVVSLPKRKKSLCGAYFAQHTRTAHPGRRAAAHTAHSGAMHLRPSVCAWCSR